MTALAPCSLAAEPILEPNPLCNVLIAYDDFQAGITARRMVDSISQGISGECSLQTSLWKFDVLGMSGLREMAIDEAGKAEMVVLALHSDEVLPPTVYKWITAWFTDRVQTGGAFVFIYNLEHEDGEEIQKCKKLLALVAQRAGMRFFSQPIDWETQEQGKNSQKVSPTNASRSGSNRDRYCGVGIRECSSLNE